MHKEQKNVGQHDRDYAGNFTQVRAAVRRKTLLLLWWVEGRVSVGTRRSSPARSPRGEQLRAYKCARVQNPS